MVLATFEAALCVNINALHTVATDIIKYINYQQSLCVFLVRQVTMMNRNELEQLCDKAKSHCMWKPKEECKWVYRNQAGSYFTSILENQAGLMKVVMKDQSGDPRSPINGKLSGLFFMAKNENGQPQANSPFGPFRLQIPSTVLLEETTNLYFTDFYCMQGQAHYVTLVACKPDSDADQFCRDKLLKLAVDDKVQNPFLYRENGIWRVCSDKLLQVRWRAGLKANFVRD